MITKKISGINQPLYIETLENGLSIFMIPFKNRKNYYINYVTKFGASITKFKVEGKEKIATVPYGVAHFLEHKMFEQKDGIDPFQFFSKYGSDANASTGYQTTSYTVEGTNDIEENLDFLLTYVNSPYFTEENVEKEKNIIIEEINMYKDEPEGKLFEESSKSVFKVHPMRVDIGGTEKSVRSITKEHLYDCYHTFYQPSNMMLFIGGNFDREKILTVIKNNQALNHSLSNRKILVKKVKEPIEINNKYKEVTIDNMMIPKFVFTIKSSLKLIEEKDYFRYSVAINLLLSILYGSSSTFREEMLNQGLMSILSFSKAIVDDLLLIEFVAESKYPKELSEKLIECFKNYEITLEEVERYKKVFIANEVLSSDHVISTVNMLVGNLIEYDEIVYDRLDIVKDITLEEVKKVKEKIDIENSSLVIAFPKE